MQLHLNDVFLQCAKKTKSFSSETVLIPIGSMYGIFIPLCTIKNHTNVRKHTSPMDPVGLILFSSCKQAVKRPLK